MQILKVPLEKDLLFEIELKKYLLYRIDLLYREYGKIPDEVSCKGHLGRHVFNIILDNNWKFGPINIVNEKGSNSIEIRFNKNITVSNQSNIIPGHDSQIDGKIIEGYLDAKSQNAVSQSYANKGFTIEKTVMPKVIIKLEKL